MIHLLSLNMKTFDHDLKVDFCAMNEFTLIILSCLEQCLIENPNTITVERLFRGYTEPDFLTQDFEVNHFILSIRRHLKCFCQTLEYFQSPIIHCTQCIPP